MWKMQEELCYIWWDLYNSFLIWLVLVERESFNRWDIIGASLAMIGAFIIFIGNKAN